MPNQTQKPKLAKSNKKIIAEKPVTQNKNSDVISFDKPVSLDKSKLQIKFKENANNLGVYITILYGKSTLKLKLPKQQMIFGISTSKFKKETDPSKYYITYNKDEDSNEMKNLVSFLVDLQTELTTKLNLYAKEKQVDLKQPVQFFRGVNEDDWKLHVSVNYNNCTVFDFSSRKINLEDCVKQPGDYIAVVTPKLSLQKLSDDFVTTYLFCNYLLANFRDDITATGPIDIKSILGDDYIDPNLN